MNRIAAFLIGAALATNALAQKISLVGGTAINPADGKMVQNAVVVINGDKIESVASRKESGVPVGSRWVECDGKFILPGYIDTHVHFFQSGDLFTRPDGADLCRKSPPSQRLSLSSGVRHTQSCVLARRPAQRARQSDPLHLRDREHRRTSLAALRRRRGADA